VALREQCARERARESAPTREQKIAAALAIVERVRPFLDTRPMTKEEWDEASGDTD
jgi:hypothetical protein